jgi:TetR/AcrR family transcriptional repressor of multidrug resistance operon
MSKRTQILLTAEKILAERGLYGLSMKLLADSAGIAAGTIYRYFENKEALITELHQYIRQEIAIRVFSDWTEQHSNQQKYNLLWRNAFDSVLENPQRLAVIEILCHLPAECSNKLKMFDGEELQPMLQLYQQGIESGELKDWPIAVLVTLSFDSAINLAKRVLRDRLEISDQLIDEVCLASWKTITK